MTSNFKHRVREAARNARVEEVTVEDFPSLDVLLEQCMLYNALSAQIAELGGRYSDEGIELHKQLNDARVKAELRHRSASFEWDKEGALHLHEQERRYVVDMSPIEVRFSSEGGFVFVGITSGSSSSGYSRHDWSTAHTVTVEADGTMCYSSVDS